MNKLNLQIYYQNIRGMRTKTQDILCNILNCNYDVLVLVETWLHNGIKDREFIDDRYVVFRRDRNTDIHHKSDGGGVLIAVHRRYKCYRINSYESTCEDLWVNVVLGNSRGSPMVTICGVYLPSPLKYDMLDRFTNNAGTNVTYNTQTLIFGDFNLSSVDWCCNGLCEYVIPISYDGRIRSCITDFMSECNLYQVNGNRNKFGKILDLVFSNKKCGIRVIESINEISIIDKYHPPLEITFDLDVDEYLPYKEITKFDYFKADYDVINNALKNINWSEIFKVCTNVDDMIILFYTEIHKIIEKLIPKSKHKSKNFPFWYSRQLIRKLKEKNKFRCRFKRYGNPLDEVKFQLFRDKCEVLIHNCYQKYIKGIENSIHINPKYFWSYLKKIRDNKPDYPALMYLNNELFSDTIDVCNGFAKHFSNVFGTSSPLLPCGHKESVAYDQYATLTVSIFEDEVEKVLKRLDQNKGAGPDNIPPIFGKRCASTLAKPLAMIFNSSLEQGYFPSMWKESRIVPVHKDGDRSDITKYRPISILSIFPKIFESLVCPVINWHMKSRFISNQHGFLRYKSTMSNLAIYINDISECMDKNIQVDSIYTDFSKAFDMVDHYVLISKLKAYGFEGNFLRWLESYLRDRKLKVVIGGFASREFSAGTGVPQGSHLGPVLFNIFINDITTCFHHSNFLLYADDLKLYRDIQNVDDCNKLQSDLTRLQQWCDKNKMTLNPDKCYHLTFTKKNNAINYDYKINEISLKKLTNIRDLGVIVDNKLSFISHVDKITSQAFRISGLIIRSTKQFRKSVTRLVLFFALSRSILEYCSIVWNPHYKVHSNRIERVQKKFLRHVAFRDRSLKSHPTYKDQLIKYRTLSLSDRRTVLDLCFLYKIIHGQIDSPQILQKIKFVTPRPNSRLKHFVPFKASFSRTNVGTSAPVNRIIKSYNKIVKELDVDIYHDSIKSFKSKLKAHFLQNPSI